MADLIDREKLLEVIDDFYPTTVSCYATAVEARAARYRHNMFIDAIKNAPTVDAVPIVRCKDCMFYNTSGHPDGLGWCETSRIYNIVRDDFYCGDGEKREGEKD